MAALGNYDHSSSSNIVLHKELRNIRKKNILVIGILGILLVFGPAIALAQNTSSEKTKDIEDHECTPEMMKDMSENCPEQMMQSGACENMMNAANESPMEAGCSGMMGNGRPEDTETKGTDHCGGMGSVMGSMMGSSTTKATL